MSYLIDWSVLRYSWYWIIRYLTMSGKAYSAISFDSESTWIFYCHLSSSVSRSCTDFPICFGKFSLTGMTYSSMVSAPAPIELALLFGLAI